MPRRPDPDQVFVTLLRRAVREHATAERRLHHVPILHLGRPDEPHEVFAVLPGESTDHALRADVVAAMRHREASRSASPSNARPTLVWLTRSGGLEIQDVDTAWHAAARQAYAEAGADLRFAVVNRRGWHELTREARREWARPQARP